MYTDLLDGRIDNETYERLSKTTNTELREMVAEASAIGSASDAQIEMGVRILELAQSASIRFKRADTETKRKMILELTESATLKDGIVQVTLKEPYKTMYDSMVEAAELAVENQKLKSGTPDWTHLELSNEIKKRICDAIIPFAFAA